MARRILAVGLAFGHRGQSIGSLPVGTTNIDLARLIASDYTTLSYISVQHEIGTELKQAYRIWPDFEVYEHRIKGRYLNTLEGLEQIIDDWQKQQVNPSEDDEIWVYCHQTHKSGIQSMFAKLGLKVTKFVTTSVYDHQSAQWWTRGPLHVLVYKVVEGYRYWRRGEVTFSDLIHAFIHDVLKK